MSSFNNIYYKLLRLFVVMKLSLVRLVNMGENSAPVRGFRKILAFLFAALTVGARVIFKLLVFILSLAQRFLSNFKTNITAEHSHVRMAYDYITDSFKEIKYGRRQRFAPCVFLLAVVISIFSATYLGSGVEVFVKGKSYGFVESRGEVLEIVSQIETETAEYLGRPYNLNADITYKMSYMDHSRMADKAQLKEDLFADLDDISTKYVLLLDGEIVGAHTSKTSLELLKQKVLDAKAPTGEGMHSSFVQDITIEERMVANSYIKTLDEIESELMANTMEMQVHNVEKGDTFSKIAQMYGISTSELKNLNPDVEETRIQIGSEIRVAAAVPVVSVKSTQTITYNETIAYDVEVEYSDSMYKNQSKITREGAVGTSEVVADVIYIDGVEVERVEVSRTVINEPVTEIKVVGTKTPPAKSATGSFRWPLSGTITSRYGYRWGSEFHTGLDIAKASGSAIVASDGGTVTLARRNGNYGNCVIIDHGNGYSTLYGHCSKLLVTKGQKVAKGEKIALVGSTGRSTGPHLHFEVKKNGKTINPVSVLP